MGILLLLFGILVVLALFSLVFVSAKSRSRTLTQAQKELLEKKWDALERIEDTARRVLEADSILAKALNTLGYQGSLGEQLKTAGPRFTNADAVWAAHKLRNHIAHEPGVQVSEQECSQAIARLRRAFDDLC